MRTEPQTNRKYSAESSTIVATITETLIPVIFNFAADKMINAKARKSDSYKLSIKLVRGSVDCTRTIKGHIAGRDK